MAPRERDVLGEVQVPVAEVRKEPMAFLVFTLLVYSLECAHLSRLWEEPLPASCLGTKLRSIQGRKTRSLGKDRAFGSVADALELLLAACCR